MTRTLRDIGALLLLATCLALPAVALADKHGKKGGGRHGVPEFDATAVGAITALIAGGGLLVARRRKS